MEDYTAEAFDDDGASTVISFFPSKPSEKAVVFNHDSEVVAAANTSYLQPAVKNYELVDTIIEPDVLCQVTGAHKHPCKQKDLHDVLQLLENPAASRLYFVLPPNRFINFRYQRYLDSKRKRMMMPTYVNVRKIQQFAMEVKFGSSEAGSKTMPYLFALHRKAVADICCEPSNFVT
ncbi:Crinkler (CRN) family protein [Phytophthora palmivora]|uniref:Crinkler (CRN) family protein n=1 Tax=Phytophthora palmivora TaxID=4796 RepID=A0A2P4Y6Q2_9STRA|nr:Crinkler (CRN) family protein [Phytophthora palmivora]